MKGRAGRQDGDETLRRFWRVTTWTNQASNRLLCLSGRRPVR